MKTLFEIKDFMLSNASYGYDIDAGKIQKGKIDKQIDFVLSKVDANEEVLFAILTTGIYSGSRIVCGGNCILFITNKRIIYGNTGLLSATIKTININECKDVEADSFGLLKGTIKINTLTELISFSAAKKEVIRLSGMIEKALAGIRESTSNETSNIANIYPVDEIKKYKELLDSGIITQEDFDAKKKQLLGL